MTATRVPQWIEQQWIGTPPATVRPQPAPAPARKWHQTTPGAIAAAAAGIVIAAAAITAAHRTAAPDITCYTAGQPAVEYAYPCPVDAVPLTAVDPRTVAGEPV